MIQPKRQYILKGPNRTSALAISPTQTKLMYDSAVSAITAWIDEIKLADIAPLNECTLLVPALRPEVGLILPLAGGTEVIVTFIKLKYHWERNFIIYKGRLLTEALTHKLYWIYEVQEYPEIK